MIRDVGSGESKNKSDSGLGNVTVQFTYKTTQGLKDAGSFGGTSSDALFFLNQHAVTLFEF